MKKGSPGGILLIAVGVILLNLGWTGKFAAVFAALSGSGTSTDASSNKLPPGDSAKPQRTGPSANPGPQNPVTPNNKQAGAILSPVYVRVVPTGTRKVVDESNVKLAENGKCQGQLQTVRLEEGDPAKNYCVDPTKLFDVPPQGGEAETMDLGYLRMQNGAMMLRYVPNVTRHA